MSEIDTRREIEILNRHIGSARAGDSKKHRPKRQTQQARKEGGGDRHYQKRKERPIHGGGMWRALPEDHER